MIYGTTTQDLVNELASTLVTRNVRGIVSGGFLLEKVAVQGFFAGFKADTSRTDEEMICLMTPYLEAYYTTQEAVNEAVKRLARATKVKAIVAKHSFSLSRNVRNCNAACLNAEGDTCTCGCGGANHGIGSPAKFLVRAANNVAAA